MSAGLILFLVIWVAHILDKNASERHAQRMQADHKNAMKARGEWDDEYDY